jgi:sulfofructosephosphate aldolase
MEPQLKNRADPLAPLRTTRGKFSMLALDQRESLRDMFEVPLGRLGTDDELREFKLTTTKLLSRAASGVLLDKDYALDAASIDAISPHCGLIVAADILEQISGEPVSNTQVDETVTAEYLHGVKASAVKFLVMWRNKERKGERADLIGRVIELAAEAGVASLIEALVAPEHGAHWTNFDEKNDAILEAAAEMSRYPFDLYKAQVPGYETGNLDGVEAASRQLSSIIGSEWVVLSNGIDQSDFAEAVEAACVGGASGFLAGRAIWSDIVGSDNLDEVLRDVARPRLEHLAKLVGAL